MKATVNEDCIGCGLCEGTCPDVFSISDDGVAVAIEEDVPEDAEDPAPAAAATRPAPPRAGALPGAPGAAGGGPRAPAFLFYGPFRVCSCKREGNHGSPWGPTGKTRQIAPRLLVQTRGRPYNGTRNVPRTGGSA